jgi:hypothetical protein
MKRYMQKNNGGGTYRTKRTRVASSRYIPRWAPNARTGGYQGKELKFYDRSYSYDTAAQTGTVYNLNWVGDDAISCPAQGDGADERIGRFFHIKSFQINGKLFMGYPPDNEAPMKTETFIIYVVLDKQCNKTNLTASGPGQNTGLVFKDSYGPKPLINLENTDRFRILAQKKIVIDPQVQPKAPNANTGYLGWSGNQERLFEIYRKCNITVQTAPGVGNGGAGATMNNAIYVMMFRSVNATAASVMGPKVDIQTRVRFCC